MRSFLIILASIVAIGAGFFVYLQTQGGRVPTADAHAKAVVPATLPSDAPNAEQIIGGGSRAWMKAFDEHTGLISQEFRAVKYDPQRDGTVKVTEPEARLYLGRSEPRQLLVVRGKDGRIVVPDSGSHSAGTMRPAAAMPTRGDLQDVTLELYDTPEDTTPNLVCTLNNVSFDNDTFRIYTESFEGPNGKLIAADQVPVKLRGRDYDFDGRGLDIRWNERDRRLQSLVVFHGERLIVKHPGALQKTKSDAPASQPVGMIFRDLNAAQIMLATVALLVDEPADVQTGAPASPAPVKIVREKTSPTYRASFLDHVQVFQSDAKLATADVMHVDYVMESNSTSTTAPSSQPTAAPSRRTRRGARPAPSRHSSANTVRPPVNAKTSTIAKPATQPDEQPVTILWTGPLRVTPLSMQLEDPPQVDKPNITLIGQPVVLTSKGSQIDCASLLYRSGDGGLIVRSSPQVPMVTMHDAGGAVLYTPLIEYGGFGETAILRGASRAEIPRQRQGVPDSVPPILTHAKWTRTCRLYFNGERQDQMSIDRAELDGDVQIDDPQINGSSDSLELAFAPAEQPSPSTQPATRPTQELRDIVATGHVRYALIDADQHKQNIECARLTLATEKGPDKKVFVHSIDAEGPVHASDDQQEMRCGRLAMTLRPSTQPSTDPSAQMSSVTVEHLIAQGDVRIANKDGDRVQGDHLTLETAPGGARTITIIGQPARVEQMQKGTVLTGPSIEFMPDSDEARVSGAGKLHAVQQGENSSKSQPIDVSWTGELHAEGKSDLVEIVDKVVVTSKADDGTIETANGDRMRIELMNDPKASSTTQPSTAPSTKPSALARAGFGSASGGNFFKDKVVKSITLIDNAEVSSVLQDDRGLRRMHLFAPQVRYDAQAKSMDVPTAGRMLIEDTRRKGGPATVPAATGDDISGATAFKWQKGMHYDDASRQVTMSGGVRIVHDGADDPTGQQHFELNSDEVQADMEPRAATRPAGADKTEPDKVKHLAAIGNVTFVSRQMHFEAARVDYDPNTHEMTAHGDERHPALVYDDQGTARGTFDELRYNLQTGEHHMRGFHAGIRK